jgi:hypothetical protein
MVNNNKLMTIDYADSGPNTGWPRETLDGAHKAPNYQVSDRYFEKEGI